MPVWNTFNSMSIRGAGGGGVAGGGGTPTPPGTKITVLNAATGSGGYHAYDPVSKLRVLPYSDSTTQIPKVALSYDLINWYSSNLPTTGSTDNVIFVTGALYSIVSTIPLYTIRYRQSSPAVRSFYYSSDGINWTKNNTSDTTGSAYNKPLVDIANAGTQIHVYPTGIVGSSQALLRSTTNGVGVINSSANITGTLNRTWVNLDSDNLLYFISYKNDTLPRYGRIYSGTLYSTFTEIPIPQLNQQDSYISKVLYISGTWYFFGAGLNGRTLILSTTDLVNFTTLYDGSVSTNYSGIEDVLYINNQFVIATRNFAGGAGSILTSTNLTTLTQTITLTPTSSNIPVALYYEDGLYIYQTNGELHTSPDAVTWTRRL